MVRHFKIGVDYHGVITSDPAFFASFNRCSLEAGHDIYILSGGYQKDIEAYMRRYNIPFTAVWSMVDYFGQQGKVKYLSDGSFKVDDRIWNAAKAQFCAKEKIDFHIDDSVVYGSFFTTPFCLYDSLQKKCVCRGRRIDFMQTPDKVLQDISAFLHTEER